MRINEIIMYFMAFGVLIGGIDRILGNRFGFGARFESGFRLLGPIGLSMAGIICLAPVLSSLMGKAVVPFSTALGIDPSIFGSVLSIDMGGYQLATELSADPQLGQFSAIIVSSLFGCTIVFTIPVGLGAIGIDDRPYFTRGILLGFIAMPVSIFTGGLLLGLSFLRILWNALPILLISLALFIGIVKKPDIMMRGFQIFAKLILIVTTLGLTLAAIEHLVGFQIIKGMTPLADAMKTVCSIGIVMLGSMPLAELIQRLLKVPFAWVRKHTGLNAVSTTALLLGMVSVTPTLAMIPEMDKRGKVVVSASLVCGAAAFSSHLAFTMGTQPDMVPALLSAKLLGGILGAVIALLATRKERLVNSAETNTNDFLQTQEGKEQL